MPEVPNIRPGKMIDQHPNNEPAAVMASEVPPEVAVTATGPDPNNPKEVMAAVEALASPDTKKRVGYKRSNRTTPDPEWPPRDRPDDECMKMDTNIPVRYGPAPGDVVAS
jgi:hypothetical protein